jgi:hypothetical protein
MMVDNFLKEPLGGSAQTVTEAPQKVVRVVKKVKKTPMIVHDLGATNKVTLAPGFSKIIPKSNVQLMGQPSMGGISKIGSQSTKGLNSAAASSFSRAL